MLRYILNILGFFGVALSSLALTDADLHVVPSDIKINAKMDEVHLRCHS